MTWPTGSVPTTNVDAGTDSPASARADLLDLINKANQMIAEAPKPAGRLVGVRYFTAGSYTYTPTAGTNAIEVLCIGGGGGGGGASTSTANAGCIGAGGGSGGYARSYISSGFSGAAITVGAGGSGGAYGTGGNGSAGGATSFGSLVSVGGGGGGQGMNTGGTGVFIGKLPGNGGSATTGDVKSPGATGDWGMMQSSAIGRSGAGGNSIFGGGGRSVLVFPTGSTVSANGIAGAGFGAGGSGAAAYYDGLSPTLCSGGDGAGGLVIVWEYS